MTHEQREIYNWALSVGGRFTKSEAVKEFGGGYYCNGDKHVGDRLSIMVNAGLLIREKPGHFKTAAIKASKPEKVDKNQTVLF